MCECVTHRPMPDPSSVFQRTRHITQAVCDGTAERSMKNISFFPENDTRERGARRFFAVFPRIPLRARLSHCAEPPGGGRGGV